MSSSSTSSLLPSSSTYRRSESKSLDYILNGQIETFFQHVYQQSVAIYHTQPQQQSHSIDNTPAMANDTYRNQINENPYTNILHHGLLVLYELMDQQQQMIPPKRSRDSSNTDATTTTTTTADRSITEGTGTGSSDSLHEILLFHNQQILSHEEMIGKYSSSSSSSSTSRCIRRHRNDDTVNTTGDTDETDTNVANINRNYTEIDDEIVILNLHAAYLDGCSIVINHADLISSYIALLCNDLQLSFPHVYANVYITPLLSQTVPPHADDRDVFIVQLLGSKQWTIYTKIPILLPYPNEQVGKHISLPVPDDVLYGPILLQTILHPGDVLYIPRGYVHEAQCVCENSMNTTNNNSNSNGMCSVHITIAIATHDWSLLGLLQSATQSIFNSLPPIEYRKAIDRQFGQHPTIQSTATSVISDDAINTLQLQIQNVIQLFQQEITINNINLTLYNKYQYHNQLALKYRNRIILQQQQQLESKQPSTGTINNEADDITNKCGYIAACKVTMHSVIRAIAENEKLLYQQLIKQKHNHPQQQQQKQHGLHVREEIYDDVMTIIQYIKQHPQTNFVVSQLRSIILSNGSVDIDSTKAMTESHQPLLMICDLTLLSLVRRCVELGAFVIIS